MKTTVILTGMIVILSLILPAVAAGGLGGDERPEEPVLDPEDRLHQLLRYLWGIMPATAPPTNVPETGPVPTGPNLPPQPEPPAPPSEPSEETQETPGAEEDEEEGDESGNGGGGMTPADPTRYVPCAVDVPERDRCGETPDPEEDPENPAPAPGQGAPSAPDVQEISEEAEQVPGALPVDEKEAEGVLATLLAPVHAAAKTATEGAKAVIAGVVTTAGFVAQEASDQAHRQATQIVALATGVVNWATDSIFDIIGADQSAALGGEGEGMRTQSAEANVIERPAGYVTLGLIAVGSLGLIAMAFAGIRKLLGLGGVALLSRIPSKDIMKNDTRAQIFDIVQSDPGVSLNEIVDRLGLSRNAIAYHLAVFESEKQVVSVKDGKYRRYFVNGGKYVNGAKDVVSTIKNDVTRNVIRFILEHPGAMQKEVCSAVGTSPSATNWHINRLEKVGLVEKAKVANTVRYSPGPSFTKYDLGEFGLAASPMA